MIRHLLASGLVLALGTGMASAVTVQAFDPVVPANTVQSSIGGTIAGVGFTMTAFTVRDDLSVIGDAAVGYDGTGFGVSGVSGTSRFPDSSVPPMAGDFTIDGVGVDQNELIRITFDRAVDVSAIAFNFEDAFDDVFISMGGFSGRFGLGGDESENAGQLTGLDALSLRGTVLDIVAGYPNQTCARVDPGQPCGGASDLFQLSGLAVAAVPLPAGGVLLLSGLAVGAGLFRRRRG